jgi:hypothetical protein
VLAAQGSGGKYSHLAAFADAVVSNPIVRITMAMQKQLAFNVLVEKRDGGYLATCVETGFVATDPAKFDAVEKMYQLLRRTVEFASKHDRLADILQPVSNEVFSKLYMCENESASCFGDQTFLLDHCGLAVKQTAYAAALS